MFLQEMIYLLSIHVIIGLVVLNTRVAALPDGAPQEACDHMTPDRQIGHHEAYPQSSNPPFRLASTSDVYHPGQIIGCKYMYSHQMSE